VILALPAGRRSCAIRTWLSRAGAPVGDCVLEGLDPLEPASVQHPARTELRGSSLARFLPAEPASGGQGRDDQPGGVGNVAHSGDPACP